MWLTPAAWWRGQALDWFDAVGLAAYAVFGAAKAIGYGVPPVPAALMGVMTACVGGIIRDVLAGEPSILLRPEIYVTAAALAAGLYVGLGQIGVPLPVAAAIGALRGVRASRGGDPLEARAAGLSRRRGHDRDRAARRRGAHAAAPAARLPRRALLAGAGAPGRIDRHCFAALTDGSIRDRHIVSESGKRVMGGESVYRWDAARGAITFSYRDTFGGRLTGVVQSRGTLLGFDGHYVASGGQRFRIMSRWARIGDTAYRAEIRSAELPQVNGTTVFRRLD